MSVDALTVERWVGEAIIKCCYIVLSARIYRCSRTLPARSRSNWVRACGFDSLPFLSMCRFWLLGELRAARRH